MCKKEQNIKTGLSRKRQKRSKLELGTERILSLKILDKMTKKQDE